MCKSEFEQSNSLHVVCGYKCAVAIVNQDKAKLKEKQAKARRKDTKERKDKLKSYSEKLNECQKYFNAYIRERDKDLPCISCGTEKQDIQYCAGHWKTRKARSDLRYNEDNVQKQCNKHCNLMLSGNVGEFRLGLIKRIGVKRVEALEVVREAVKLSDDDMKAFKKKYSNKLKGLKE